MTAHSAFKGKTDSLQVFLLVVASGLLTAAALVALMQYGFSYTIYDAWLFGIYGGVVLVIAALWRD